MECAICLEEVTETNKCVLTCGHGYHATCVMKHARRQDRCPLCREGIGAGINGTAPRLTKMPFPFDQQTFEVLKALHELEKNGTITNERWHQVKNLVTTGQTLATT